MAIHYACDNCHDVHPGYYSDNRAQWEPPERWCCYEQVHRVDDEDKGRYRHFCSVACLQGFLEAHAEAPMRNE